MRVRARVRERENRTGSAELEVARGCTWNYNSNSILLERDRLTWEMASWKRPLVYLVFRLRGSTQKRITHRAYRSYKSGVVAGHKRGHKKDVRLKRFKSVPVDSFNLGSIISNYMILIPYH